MVDLPNGEGLVRLIAVMDTLRSPGGCPWDAEQTHETLVQYLIEETYETIEAIEAGDLEHLQEELGDLLLQIYFHARIAQENTAGFNIDDVAHGIAEKLIRRHPHVFPNADGEIVQVDSSADVEANWQSLKNAEKQRTSVLDGVPVALPPLTQISKMLQRLENANRPHLVPMRATAAVEDALLNGISASDLVLAAISAIRAQGLDPESEMRSKAMDLRANIQVDEARIAQARANHEQPNG
jgi:XTP/dITP diphosphohydrolase